MSNTFKLVQYVNNETVVRFVNKLRIGKTAYRDGFEKDFMRLPFAIGRSVDYRMEEQYLASDGLDSTSTAQDINQDIRTLTIDQAKHIKITMDSLELTLDRQRDQPYLDMHLNPITKTLANTVEGQLSDVLKNGSYHVVGKPGQGITNQSMINFARGKMEKLAVPDDGRRYVAMNVDDSISMANGMANYFNNKVNSSVITDGYLTNLSGFDLFESVYAGRHTSGVGDTTDPDANGLIACGQIAATVSNGSVITLKTLANSTNGVLLKGDIIQIEGVYSVNPISKRSTGDLMTFTVTDTSVNSDGSGNATVNVTPAIIISGAKQNVTGALNLNTAVSLYSSHNYNLAYHSKGIVFCAPPLVKLEGGVISSVATSKDWAIALRYMKYANGDKASQNDKMDIIWGAQANGEYIVRVIS